MIGSSLLEWGSWLGEAVPYSGHVEATAKLLPWAASEGATTPLTQARMCR